jgi:hypothetical protein
VWAELRAVSLASIASMHVQPYGWRVHLRCLLAGPPIRARSPAVGFEARCRAWLVWVGVGPRWVPATCQAHTPHTVSPSGTGCMLPDGVEFITTWDGVSGDSAATTGGVGAWVPGCMGLWLHAHTPAAAQHTALCCAMLCCDMLCCAVPCCALQPYRAGRLPPCTRLRWCLVPHHTRQSLCHPVGAPW